MAFIIRNKSQQHSDHQHSGDQVNIQASSGGLMRLSSPVRAFTMTAESLMKAASHPNVTAGASIHQPGRRGGDTVALVNVRRAALKETRKAMLIGGVAMLPAIHRHPVSMLALPTLRAHH